MQADVKPMIEVLLDSIRSAVFCSGPGNSGLSTKVRGVHLGFHGNLQYCSRVERRTLINLSASH